jgi:uncharacterized membrane protein
VNVFRHVVTGAIAVLLLTSGVLHLVAPDAFFAQVPAFLPFRAAIIFVSGVLEILLGVGLLVPRTRRRAAKVTALFFLVIFPGNIWQAIAQVDAFGLDTDLRRYLRLLFQPVLIVAVLYGAGITRRRTPPDPVT